MSASRHRVWDVPVRVVHWAIVAGVALQYASGEFDLLSMRVHALVGYALLALVLFRIAWGFVGSDSARFGAFVRGPGAALAYLRTLRTSRAGHPGHNPLGAWSTLALLASLALQAVSGLWTSDDILEQGPRVDGASAALVDAMGSIHRINEKVLLGLVALHVVAVAWHALARREDLLRAMFDGRKTLEADPRLRFASHGRALAVGAFAALAVWWLVR